MSARSEISQPISPSTRLIAHLKISCHKEGFKSLAVLLLSFLLTFAAGAVGALASVSAQQTYALIKQPTWAPPAWIFGPVWTSLYVLMALAAWLVWRQRERMRIDIALIVYAVHLLIQALWSWLFFGIGRADLAMLDILILGTIIAWLTFVLIGLADLNHGHGLAASEFAAACYAGICAFKCLYGEDGAVAHENGLADVETRAFLRDFFPKMHIIPRSGFEFWSENVTFWSEQVAHKAVRAQQGDAVFFQLCGHGSEEALGIAFLDFGKHE